MLSVRTGEEEEDPCYSPQKALTLALTDWLQEFLIPDHPGGRRGGTSAPAAPVHEGSLFLLSPSRWSEEGVCR